MVVTTSTAEGGFEQIEIPCQFPGCSYVAKGNSEPIAIVMLSSHNNVHLQTAASTNRRSHIKPPQIARPEVKQDISAEEWYSFLEKWKRFKRITDLPNDEVADQLLQCCERPLSRLLLKENPLIVEEGETALIEAIKRMAVLQVAISVRRTKLLSMRQEPGQMFREFFANVRATASTCDYTIQCPHACCSDRDPIDYTSRVVKDILVAGIADDEIRKDVLAHPQLDEKIDKDIVKFVEEKEMARNACQATSRMEINSLSGYRKKSRDQTREDTNNKLSLKGKCQKCGVEIALYIRYRSGKMNKDSFTHCLKCFRLERDKTDKKGSESQNSAFNFVESLSTFHRDRANTDPQPF